MLDRLQKHTIEIYELDKQRFTKDRIKARTLLSENRFDLYAKLFYIRNRESNKELALQIYREHILAFNPDGKEPGRDEKSGVDNFVHVFDQLIDDFKEKEFDANLSLVPVDKNNIPLDGSHRIAALAYYDKEIDILRFSEIESKAIFDYKYFIKRGLSIHTADFIAQETLFYTSNLHLACFWPKMGDIKEKQFAFDSIQKYFPVYYSKSLRMSLEGLSRFMYESYKHQDWVGNANNNYKGARDKALNCFSSHGIVQFVLFKAENLNDVLKVKDEIRMHYQLDKHALHITDDDKETEEMMQLIFTEKVNQFQNSTHRLKDKVQEYKTILKNVYWINLKVKIAHVLKKLKLYR